MPPGQMPDFEMLLDPEQAYDSPESRQAMSNALRRQYGLGMVGQLMGVAPTVTAGNAMREQAGTTLKSALAKQQAVKQRKLQEAQDAAQQQRWESEQGESKRRWGAEFGLSQQELKIKQDKDARDAAGGDWKVRLDPMGNPLGWMNDRGDYKTVDGQTFNAPGGAAQFTSGQGGPAMPTPAPVGGGGGAQGSPQRDPFGLPKAPFGQPDSLQGINPEMRAGMRLGRLKSLPAEQQNAYANAKRELNNLPGLIAEVEANKGSFGLLKDVGNLIPGQPGTAMGVAGDVARSFQEGRRSPQETEVRSKVFNQAYEVIHALAGAALSTGERQRILQFLPGPNDPPEKILGNLRAAVATARNSIVSLEDLAGIPQENRTDFGQFEERRQNGSMAAAPDEQIIDLPPRR